MNPTEPGAVPAEEISVPPASDALPSALDMQTSTQPEQPPQPAEAPAQPAEPVIDEASQLKQQVDELRRVIAGDPYLSDQYAQMKYGVPLMDAPPPQPVQYNQPPMMGQMAPAQEEAPPWNDENPYNPYDQSHQQFLFRQEMKQMLAPFQEFIDAQQQEAEMIRQHQQQQQMQQLEQGIVQSLDKQVPGVAGLLQVENPSVDQLALWNHARTEFLRELQGYHPKLHSHPAVHQEIVQKIAPGVKALAQKWGVFAQAAAPQAAQPAAGDTYVESSNVAPVMTGNAFDQAFQNDDMVGMMRALR